MKKVLFVITKSNWGGAQRYVYDLATNLPKESFEVKVALGGPPTGGGLLKEKLEEAKIETIGIPYLQRDINATRELLSFFSLIKIFAKEKPDIIHLNSSKAGGLGAAAAWLCKLFGSRTSESPEVRLPKIVFTVHGWAFNETRTFRAKSAMYLSQWATALLCDSSIIISRHDYRQALSMLFIPKRKFALIPLGIPNGNLKYLPKTKAETGLNLKPSKNTRIGTIAEFTKNKGLDYLLDAINILKGQKLEVVIIGDGEEKKRIEKRIDEENLKESISTCGFVPHAAKYIKAFDIFVLPSLKEGLPYTILEAMNAGVPVVASSVGGIPDLIEHEKSGFLAIPANPQSLADALGKLVDDIKTRNKFGKISKQRALEKFSFSAMLSRTIALYQSQN